MNEEKEIEEMADLEKVEEIKRGISSFLCCNLHCILCDDCDYYDDCDCTAYGDCENRKIADIIYKAGYRKADEVRKETARECSNWLHENCCYEEHYQLVDCPHCGARLKEIDA